MEKLEHFFSCARVACSDFKQGEQKWKRKQYCDVNFVFSTLRFDPKPLTSILRLYSNQLISL